LFIKEEQVMEIRFISKNANEVAEIIQMVKQDCCIKWFSGLRWTDVEKVAVTFIDNRPVAIGSLSLKDEGQLNRPTIMGMWVTPQLRGKGIGTDLICKLAEECISKYKTYVSINTNDSNVLDIACKKAMNRNRGAMLNRINQKDMEYVNMMI
jgi:GNAT superfamily N-acetyltransferase